VLAVDRAIDLSQSVRGSSSFWELVYRPELSEDSIWSLPDYLSQLRDDWLRNHPDEISGAKMAIAGISTDLQTDSTVSVVLRRTNWREVRAFQEAVETHSRPDLTYPLMHHHFDFRGCPVPNIAVAHCIVETSDSMFLVTQRSPSVRYHPRHWSVSLEEGLSFYDLEADQDILEAATVRGVREELGIDVQNLVEGFDVLGVLVEFPILNPALVTFLRIDCSASQIRRSWKNLCQRSDSVPEVIALSFLPVQLESLIREWRSTVPSPQRESGTPGPWHPTSRFRLLVAMIHCFGVEDVVDVLMGL